MKKFEKEFKQFTQMFGRNGSFLSNVQVRAEWEAELGGQQEIGSADSAAHSHYSPSSRGSELPSGLRIHRLRCTHIGIKYIFKKNKEGLEKWLSR